MRGETQRGEASLLGMDYVTISMPIEERAGRVVGIL